MLSLGSHEPLIPRAPVLLHVAVRIWHGQSSVPPFPAVEIWHAFIFLPLFVTVWFLHFDEVKAGWHSSVFPALVESGLGVLAV